MEDPGDSFNLHLVISCEDFRMVITETDILIL